MGTNCHPLLADILLYSHEAEFIQSLLSARKKQLASQFSFTYIDGVLSSVFIRRIIYKILHVCPFDYSFCGEWEGWDPVTGLTTPVGGYRYPNWPS